MLGNIAPYIFTVVIPVVAAAMIPHIGPIYGFWIILCSAIIGLVDVASVYSSKHHGKARVIPILAMAVGALILGGGAITYFLGPSWYFWSSRDSIAWNFDEGKSVIGLEWSVADPPIFLVSGFNFEGKNGAEPLYQVQAWIVVDQNKKAIPLYIAVSGRWVQLSEIQEIPAHAQFFIGCQMRDDTLHCGAFTQRISPEQFLSEVGGFTFFFAHDGEPAQSRHFSSKEIRKKLETQKTEAIRNMRSVPVAPRLKGGGAK